MAISVEEYARALHLALQESSPEDVDTVIQNLIDILTADGKLDLYAEIVEYYETIALEEGQTKHAEAVFAREASSNKNILDELNAIAGPKLEIRSKTDHELVGGMVLRVDDTFIDASTRGSLTKMQKELNE